MTKVLRSGIAALVWALLLSCCHLCNIAHAVDAKLHADSKAQSHSCCAGSEEPAERGDDGCSELCRQTSIFNKVEPLGEHNLLWQLMPVAARGADPTVELRSRLDVLKSDSGVQLEHNPLDFLGAGLTLSANAPPASHRL